MEGYIYLQIGNAVINDETDTKGMFDFLGSHAIISDSVAAAIDKFCDFSPNATKQSEECNKAADEAEKYINAIDIYNIYAPLCTNPNLTLIPKKNTVKH